jgi:hypothetical protein
LRPRAVASLAGVSHGNVDKVETILTQSAPDVTQAAVISTVGGVAV